jgi:drug/metabolite transporter (DMT)-like permease
MSRRTTALLSLILVMVIWGATYVVTKTAVREIPPFTLAVLRYLIAAIVLVPLAMARAGGMRLPRPIPLAPLAWMALTGIAILTVGFNYGLIYGSASQGALVYALTPAAVAVAAVFALNEILPKRRLAGIVLSVAGAAMVVTFGKADSAAPRPVLGALCMLAGILAWAYYTVIAKRFARADQLVVTAWVMLLGVAMLLPLAAFELVRTPMPWPSAQAWLGTLFLGAAASAVAYVLYNRVLRVLDASLVAAWFTLDPLFGVVTAVAFLGEVLRTGQMVGGAVACVGMWLAASVPTAPLADANSRE